MVKEMAATYIKDPGDLAWDAAHGAHAIWQARYDLHNEYTTTWGVYGQTGLEMESRQAAYDLHQQQLSSDFNALCAMAGLVTAPAQNPEDYNPFPTPSAQERLRQTAIVGAAYPLLRPLTHLRDAPLGYRSGVHTRLLNIIGHNSERVVVPALEEYGTSSKARLGALALPVVVGTSTTKWDDWGDVHLDISSMQAVAPDWRQRIARRGEVPRGLGKKSMDLLERYLEHVFEVEQGAPLPPGQQMV